MREAIGGTWLFSIVITFVVLFTSFLAYSISYTKAFNLKNEIINLIERNEGYTRISNGKPGYTNIVLSNATNTDLENNGSVEALALLKVRQMGYNYSIIDAHANSGANLCNTSKNTTGVEGCAMDGGYCVYKLCTTDAGKTKVHYKITTFIALEIPIINLLVKIPISGETKTLYYDRDGTCNPVCK